MSIWIPGNGAFICGGIKHIEMERITDFNLDQIRPERFHRPLDIGGTAEKDVPSPAILP